ncbi:MULTISPECIES: gluconokinase [Arthrobacter]|uniref:Gluconokinase n=1 Tax=Arthrobacter terricola TaxID=2547396 RepID=A0A4R5KA28_9MICC|nr:MULTISPECIES: gluconokinase [Arthrobacter]MBT8162905.1 gluconokinase [Arthrobacter sp. GN70]TDF91692.1 gluconokinase [Arthrobacter terricola]
MVVPPIVVMGVSGSGKSAVGRALALSLGAAFLDADDLHPASNKALMAAGTALTDADRFPWLRAVAAALAGSWNADRPPVVACSALKRTYRDLLRETVPELLFVYLHGDTGTIAGRLADRDDEFMPASLLASQIDTIEPPGPDEPHLRVPLEHPVEHSVDLVLGALHRSGAASRR